MALTLVFIPARHQNILTSSTETLTVHEDFDRGTLAAPPVSPVSHPSCLLTHHLDIHYMSDLEIEEVRIER